jgi:putative flippase GtrA
MIGPCSPVGWVTRLDLIGNSSAEFLRFGLVGLATNGAAYSIYLLLTGFGLEPLPALAVTYIYSILQSFFLNRVWSYRNDGPAGPSFFRYCIAYVSCYVLNSFILLVLIEFFFFNHKIVQALCIALAGIGLYFVQKFWVFAR